jgi:transcriptional regulator with XRE-family HTH domain
VVTEGSFDLPGTLRRIRRSADLSQRELARAADLSASAVAHAEQGSRDLSVGQFVRAASCAGFRLAVVDEDGREVVPMADDAVRDHGGRRFPAHLDTCPAVERPSREERRDRRRPIHTFDRDRQERDRGRLRTGTPEDHQRPRPEDDPAVREARERARRRRAQHEKRQERWTDLRRRVASGEATWSADPPCDCPPGCDPAREVLAEVHVEDCPCRCDIA